MKYIAAACLCLLLFSCFNNHTETDRLNQRITRLEQRLDSLTGNTASVAINTNPAPNPIAYSTSFTSAHCQALTKKGRPCKRKAKNNNHCWQHGG